MKIFLIISAVILGVLFVAIGFYYFITPAGSLPPFVPGFEIASSHVHVKHGVGSLLLGIGLFVYAWFKSAPQKSV